MIAAGAFRIYCNTCKKIHNSSDPHDFSHFKAFFPLPLEMYEYQIVEVKFFGDTRKVLRVINDQVKKEFIYKIFHGRLTDVQMNAFSILRDLDHINLCNLNGPIQTNEENTETALRFDWIPNTLLTFINSNPQINTQLFGRWFLQICQAISYLHENGMIHGYMELDSIFIEGKQGNETIRVGGLDKTICIDDLKDMGEVNIGNKNSLAPEMIEGNSQFFEPKLIDVWNLGVLMHQFLTGGKTPFPGKNLLEIQNNIVQKNFLINPNKLQKYPPKIWELISSLNLFLWSFIFFLICRVSCGSKEQNFYGKRDEIFVRFVRVKENKLKPNKKQNNIGTNI